MSYSPEDQNYSFTLVMSMIFVSFLFALWLALQGDKDMLDIISLMDSDF